MDFIDSHIHFWQRADNYRIWPAEKFELLDRDFGPGEFAKAYSGVLPKHLVVQAAASTQETLALLKRAETVPETLGVVGWLDADRPDVGSQLDELLRSDLLVGIRYECPEDAELAIRQIRRLAGPIGRAGLVLDLLAWPKHLPVILQLSRESPDTRFNINHCGRPVVSSREWGKWAEDIAAVGARPNVSCKLSGLLERSGMTWQPDDLRPYIGHILSAFGPDRTFYASNWPVIGLAGRADDWLALCKQEIGATLGGPAVKEVLYNSVRKFYRLGMNV